MFGVLNLGVRASASILRIAIFSCRTSTLHDLTGVPVSGIGRAGVIQYWSDTKVCTHVLYNRRLDGIIILEIPG